MKKLFTILTLISLGAMHPKLNAQTNSFDCNVTSQFAEEYLKDCTNSSLGRAAQLDPNFNGTVAAFPVTIRDTILNAMMAVYNSNLPARDTVIDYLDIHEYGPSPTNEIVLITEPASQAWAASLIQTGVQSGDAYLDSLLTLYNFSVDSTYNYSNTTYIVLKSPNEYNILKIIVDMAVGNIPVQFPNVVGDGNHIYAVIDTDAVTVSFQYAWEDCPSGCAESRIWSFKVDYNCNVTYIGVSGDTTSYPGVVFPPLAIEDPQAGILSVYPNPTRDLVYIDLPTSKRSVAVYGVNGSHVCDKDLKSNAIDISELSTGFYVIVAEADGKLYKTFVYKY